MCDEEQYAAKLKRIHGEDLIVNLSRDIEAFFAQKYGTSSCQFQRVVVQGDDVAQVDFTVSRGEEFTRRYVGNAGYVDGHSTDVVRIANRSKDQSYLLLEGNHRNAEDPDMLRERYWRLQSSTPEDASRF